MENFSLGEKGEFLCLSERSFFYGQYSTS